MIMNRNVITGVALMTLVGGFFYVPFYFTTNEQRVNLSTTEKHLTPTQKQRGMWSSPGRDGGRDPDYDFKHNKYVGKTGQK